LAAIIAAAAVLRAPLCLAQAGAAEFASDSLRAFVTTLVPDHDDAALFGDFRILTREIPWLGPLAAATTAWLDAEAGGSFATIATPARATIVNRMALAPPDSVPRQGYVYLRHFAMELYYARPDAIAGLPLEPAPQPVGYPPPWT
jgi:hypothetical protein